MTLAQRAISAYAEASSPARSSRSVEYDAFSKISHRLRNAANNRRESFPEFASAVSDNRRLWTTIAIDVAQNGNQLPQELKARLFWLAEFTENESKRLLRGEGDVGVLIEINAAIMQGLRPPEEAS